MKLFVLLMAPLLAAATGPEPNREIERCSSIESDGSSWARCFDPGNGLELGGGADVPALSPVLVGGLRLRSTRLSRSKGSRWYNTHRALMFRYSPAPTLHQLEGTLYEGIYRRHLDDGHILVPLGSSPLRVPFPFDVAIALTAGRYERRIFEGPGATLETARAAILFDPLRSDSDRARLGIGPAFGHLAQQVGRHWEHALSPFTLGQLEASFESGDGLWALRASGVAGIAFPLEGAPFLRARGELSIERVVLAINDQPFVLRLSGAGAHQDVGLERENAWSAGLTLLVRIGSQRRTSGD